MMCQITGNLLRRQYHYCKAQHKPMPRQMIVLRDEGADQQFPEIWVKEGFGIDRAVYKLVFL